MNGFLHKFVLLYIICFVELSFSFEQNKFKDEKQEIKIGIIGGGIGGAATAYFLKESFQDQILVHIYESKEVGGRLSTSSTFDKEFETGGSIIHPHNEYMNYFVQKLGLEKSYGCSSKFGIFNGKDFVFTQSDWSAITTMKYFWRYGLDIYRLKTLNSNMLSSFSRIYEHQRRGKTFNNVQDLLGAMDENFVSLLNKTTRSHLKELSFNDLIIDELVTACTLVNYGQSPNINAFVGSVAVAAASPGLWSVVGGNKRVPEELIKHSEAILREHVVTKIARNADGKFKVYYKLPSPKLDKGDEEFFDYDAVAISTPLTKDISSIEFLNFRVPFHFHGRYERIVCTLVEGELNAQVFKTKTTGENIEEILANNASLFYNSVGIQFSVDKDSCNNSYKVYKVFSSNKLTKKELSHLFDNVVKIEEKIWLAYPHYSVGNFYGQIELVPGLYYNNAIEQAASAMEMSAISAKNSALLIAKYITDIYALNDAKKNKDEL